MWPLKSIVSEKTSPILRDSTHIYEVSREIDGKTFIFRVNLGMWPLKLIVSEKTIPVLRVWTHVYGVPKDIDGKPFILSVNLGMWPLKLNVSEKQSLFWGFQHTFMGFPRSEMENVCFQSKPRHVTPQINILRKLRPVLRFSTHIYGVSKEWDGKCFFQSKPRHVTPHVTPQIDQKNKQSIILENWVLFWWFQHTFMGIPRG